MTDFAARRNAMVDCQIRPSDVTKFPIISAFLSVPRESFVPDDMREVAYADGQVALDSGRVMIEPRTLAKMLDALDVSGSDMVLDVASGAGYGAVILSKMAEAVVALEDNEQQVAEAETLLAAQGVDNVAAVMGDLATGAAKHGPYDAILIEGGVETVPGEIVAQLKEGGRMAAILMDGAVGRASVGVRRGKDIHWRFVFDATAPVLPGYAKINEFAL